MLKRVLKTAGILFVVLLAAVYWFAARPALQTATGYYAKILGSGVFVAGRAPEHVEAEELGFLQGLVSATVDREAKTVRATSFGVSNEAFYRPEVGVTLVHGAKEAVLAHPVPTPMVPPAEYATLPWPQGNAPALATPDAGVDMAKIQATIDHAFEEPNPEKLRRTRAVVVIHNGKLIAEKYGEGFAAETPLAGWSMTKSITNAMLGILVRQGKLDIHAPAAVPEWKGVTDGREKLTTDVLLRMSSGLEFSEEYFNPLSDATNMLFRSTGAAAVAAAKPLAHEPEKVWYYSSGTSNILSRLIRDIVGEKDYPDFANKELFAPIGMYSALLETDAEGVAVGSSFGWATARDWARFGQLFLNDGVWNGNRILPEGWVKYSTTLTPPCDTGEYGAHWWLNAEVNGKRDLATVPTDLYYCSGFEGQRVFVLPSRNAVIVRLGLTQQSGAFPWQDFLNGFYEALPAKG